MVPPLSFMNEVYVLLVITSHIPTIYLFASFFPVKSLWRQKHSIMALERVNVSSSLNPAVLCLFMCPGVQQSSGLAAGCQTRYTGHLKWCRAPIFRHLGPSSPAGTLHQGEVRVHHGQVPVQWAHLPAMCQWCPSRKDLINICAHTSFEERLPSALF